MTRLWWFVTTRYRSFFQDNHVSANAFEGLRWCARRTSDESNVTWTWHAKENEGKRGRERSCACAALSYIIHIVNAASNVYNSTCVMNRQGSGAV
jgi:hypothetical protein